MSDMSKQTPKEVTSPVLPPCDEAFFREEVRDCRCIYDGRIYRAEKLLVALPDGATAEREVIRHHGGAVILAVTSEGEILLEYQYRVASGQVLIELPAGKLEEGEDPLEAARRELEEETGFCAKRWKKLGAFYATPGYDDEILHLYVAEELEQTEAHPDEHELVQVFRVSPAEAMQLVRENKICDAKTALAISMYITETEKG